MTEQMELGKGHSGKEREPIKGIFSTQELRKVGAGTTVRKTVQKAFWFVEEKDGIIMVQPLNANYVPSGPRRKVEIEELIEKFQPEPEFYMQTVFPRMRELNKTIARADRHRQRGEGFSAEFEYNNALKVDEENVRANFGLGLTYLDRGEVAKADNIFERLVKLEAAFDSEHKHLFNEFGISLRKNNMLDQAMDYYSRALELSGDDENLLYNIARVYLERKDYSRCIDHLLRCLGMNPALEAGVRFLMWLKQKDLVPQERMADANRQLALCAKALKGERGDAAPTADASGAELGTASAATPSRSDETSHPAGAAHSIPSDMTGGDMVAGLAVDPQPEAEPGAGKERPTS